MPRPRQGDILGGRVGKEAEWERDGSGGGEGTLGRTLAWNKDG